MGEQFLVADPVRVRSGHLAGAIGVITTVLPSGVLRVRTQDGTDIEVFYALCELYDAPDAPTLPADTADPDAFDAAFWARQFEGLQP